MEDERPYCSDCYENLDDDGFDYRYEYPLCLDCGAKHEEELTDEERDGE